MELLPLFLIVALMWVLLIRPQQRRLRQQQEIVASVRPGDEIVTHAGIYGTVQAIDEEAMLLQVAPGVELRVVRGAVSHRIRSGADPDPDVADVAEPTRDEEP